ncbi:uncharacterized protein LY89DRAFT_253129 [Mollisia scopiformis]|uniref:Ubiquitin 3 binding protein But2 C-terminal domain-containing protein n=1 Tax=Mollisia scopiformis TaxID=149040 RepID=A0A194WSM9_MOLSC|nr:uncharacterized protein LY89DRAFT_253129 [Mollisia scopiformis]KUJ10965.1 hypothetical protein LY89DRAFT_253129 [Mollisia scopiformis]
MRGHAVRRCFRDLIVKDTRVRAMCKVALTPSGEADGVGIQSYATRSSQRAQWNPTCPPNGTLPKDFISPSLIVPVSAKLPNVAFGPTNFPIITPNDFCSIFNQIIPPSAVNKTCTLEFLFPSHSQTLAPYAYSGGGHFTFTGYAFGSGATPQTTYNHQPPAGPSPPQPPAVLKPGMRTRLTWVGVRFRRV